MYLWFSISSDTVHTIEQDRPPLVVSKQSIVIQDNVYLNFPHDEVANSILFELFPFRAQGQNYQKWQVEFKFTRSTSSTPFFPCLLNHCFLRADILTLQHGLRKADLFLATSSKLLPLV
jgi:hypothetical protein